MTVHLLDLTSEGSQLRADLVREAKERKARMAAAVIREKQESLKIKELAGKIVRLAAQEEDNKQKEQVIRQVAGEALKRLEELREAVARASAELKSFEERLGIELLATPKIKHIALEVAKHFGVTPLDIISHRATPGVCLPRHVAMYIAKTTTVMSYPQIASRMGRRDHTTIMHAVRKITAKMAVDDDFRATVEHLRDKISPPTAMAAE